MDENGWKWMKMDESGWTWMWLMLMLMQWPLVETPGVTHFRKSFSVDSGQGRIDSVKINPSVLMMRKCTVTHWESQFGMLGQTQGPVLENTFKCSQSKLLCHSLYSLSECRVFSSSPSYQIRNSALLKFWHPNWWLPVLKIQHNPLPPEIQFWVKLDKCGQIWPGPVCRGQILPVI